MDKMANTVQKLPSEIVRAISNGKLPLDSVIYYEKDQGWVYEKRDVNLVNSQQQNPSHVSSSSFFAENARPLESLGPFGTQPANISITILLGTDMYSTTFGEKLIGITQYNDAECVGQHAPLTLVTLNGAARDIAHIPRDATHFCWVYPPAGLAQLSDEAKKKIDKKVANNDPSYTFFAFGGFVYFRADGYNYTMLKANALVKSDNGLVFNGPFEWESNYTAYLAKQGRFQNVTVSSLLDLGIKHYCFINPNEKLPSSVEDQPKWIPAENGGFVYLYDSPGRPHPLDRYFTVADTPNTDQMSTQVMSLSLIRQPRSLASPLPQTSVNKKQSKSSLQPLNTKSNR